MHLPLARRERDVMRRVVRVADSHEAARVQPPLLGKLDEQRTGRLEAPDEPSPTK